MSTNVDDFLSDLDAGLFKQKVSAVLSDVANGVINTRKKGRVLVEFEIEAMDEQQVMIIHKVEFNKPTLRGKKGVIEDNVTQTPMFVGKKGALTLMQEDQMPLFAKDGDNTAKLKVVSH